MTPPDRWTALEEAARKATPGPWIADRQDDDGGEIYFAIHAQGDYEFITNINDGRALSNAKYIARADPATILALIAEARAGKRTPGTFECCNKCKATEKTWWDECKHTDCPLRTTQGDQT